MMASNQTAIDEVDGELLANAALSIIGSDEGAQVLAQSAGNTENPAAGVAQYLMMLMQSIEQMLTQAGITDVNYGAWLAKGGSLERIVPDITEALEGAGVQLSPSFPSDLMNALLERIKGAAQAEGGAGPQAPQAAPMQAPQPAAGGLLGMV